MAKIEKIGNTQVIDNKEDNFFYFPMISMACTGSGETGADRRFPVSPTLSRTISESRFFSFSESIVLKS